MSGPHTRRLPPVVRLALGMHPDRNAPRVQQLEYERRALIRVIPVALVISVVLLIVLPHGWVVVLAVCLASLLQSAGVAVSLRRERRRA